MPAIPLDDPVWYALTGPHANIAIGRGGARHYPRDKPPFSAIAEPLAGAGGFEPPYAGIKIRCLTTWLRPNYQ
jgi:hypothetical protein